MRHELYGDAVNQRATNFRTSVVDTATEILYHIITAVRNMKRRFIMTLGNRILELRAHAGLSQEEFGEKFGTTRQTVSKWELDQAVPEIAKIVAMARTFGVTTDSIISDGISTFDGEYDRFVCGIYKKRDLTIAETERVAITYEQNTDATVLTSCLYVGMQGNKRLRGVVVFDVKAKRAQYAYSDDGGNIKTNSSLSEKIGESFDRSVLDGMRRVETFFGSRGDAKLPTVGEAGFRTCLTAWRRGTRYYCREGIIFAEIHVGEVDYFFHMEPRLHENIYCGFVENVPHELGCYSGRQQFRIRNLADNSADFTNSFSKMNEVLPPMQTPSFENGIDFDPKTCAPGIEHVLRFGDDFITVSNCGDELTYFRCDPDMIEYFDA